MEAVPGVFFFTLGFYVFVLIIFQLLFSGLGHYVLPKRFENGKLGNIWVGPKVVYKNCLKLIYTAFQIIYKTKTWILSNHLGIDQTLYLYYQTEGMKLMIMICLIQVAVLLVSTLFMGVNIKEGFYRFLSLESHYKLNNWGYVTFHAVLMTMIMTLFCIRIRRMIIAENYKKFRTNEKKKDIKRSTWHQLRTLEIKGGIESDFPGNVLKEIIRKIMKKQKISGKLMCIKAVPSLENVVELEKKREDMLTKFKLKKSLKCSWLRTW